MSTVTPRKILKTFSHYFETEFVEFAVKIGWVLGQRLEPAKREVALVAYSKCKYWQQQPSLRLLREAAQECLELASLDVEESPLLHFDVEVGTVFFANKRLAIKAKLQSRYFQVLYSAWLKNSFARIKLFKIKLEDSDDAIRQRISRLRTTLRDGGMPDLADAIKRNVFDEGYRISFDSKVSNETIQITLFANGPSASTQLGTAK
jgi:hypothetical protein